MVFVDSLFQYFAVFGPVAENGPGDFAVLVCGECFPRANRESAVAVQKQGIEGLGEFAAHCQIPRTRSVFSVMDVVFGDVHSKHKRQIGRNPFRQIAGFPHREINERVFALADSRNEPAFDI